MNNSRSASPDIRAAEENLVARKALVSAAKRAYFPRTQTRHIGVRLKLRKLLRAGETQIRTRCINADYRRPEIATPGRRGKFLTA